MSAAEKALDQLNAAIKRIEEELAKRYHVRARVELPTADGKRWLVFGKLANAWRLIVESERSTFADRLGTDYENPLVNVSSTVRVSAMAKLSELRAALEEEEARSLERARIATSEAEAFLVALTAEKENEK